MHDIHALQQRRLHDAQIKLRQKSQQHHDQLNHRSSSPGPRPTHGKTGVQSGDRGPERGVAANGMRGRHDRSGLTEDSHLFAQVLEDACYGQREGNGESDEHQDGDAALFGGSGAAASSTRIASLLGQVLVPCLNEAAEGPLDVVLCLPKMGNINVKAQRSRQSWEIALSAEQDVTQTLLETHRRHCEHALSRATDTRVSLHIVSRRRYNA